MSKISREFIKPIWYFLLFFSDYSLNKVAVDLDDHAIEIYFSILSSSSD